MIFVPANWPDDMKISAYEAGARAEAVLTARRASHAARAVFWAIFSQRNHIAAKEDLSRKRLAEISGCSERSISTAVAFLRRADMIFWGSGSSHRWNTPIMLNPNYLAHAVHQVIHRPSTLASTGKQTSRSHYKDLPQGLTALRKNSLYSDPARSARSFSAGNGKSKRPLWSSSAQLVAGLGLPAPPS